MLLTITARASSFAPSFLANSAAISEALDYDRFFEALSSCFFAVSIAIRAFVQVAVVISEALDSIPTFDRLPKLQALFLSAAASDVFASRRQRSPRL